MEAIAILPSRFALVPFKFILCPLHFFFKNFHLQRACFPKTGKTAVLLSYDLHTLNLAVRKRNTKVRMMQQNVPCESKYTEHA
jgi:hypothetical protein